MLRVIIVDDERLARQALRQLFAREEGVEIVGEADSVVRARELIAIEKPDAIFLDIRMPGADGFTLLEGLNPAPKTVFVTAHTEHAVRAFETEAVDYVLKPVRAERLALSLRRLRAAQESDRPPYQSNDRICLNTPGGTTVAALTDLVMLQAEGDFSRVFLAGHAPLLICQTLGSYERTLPNPPFLRLDRSLLINTDRIEKIDQRSRDESTLRLRGLETPAVLGRAAWSRLRKSGVIGGA